MSSVDLVVSDLKFERHLAKLAAMKETQRKYESGSADKSVKWLNGEMNSAMEVE